MTKTYRCVGGPLNGEHRECRGRSGLLSSFIPPAPSSNGRRYAAAEVYRKVTFSGSAGKLFSVWVPIDQSVAETEELLMAGDYPEAQLFQEERSS